MWSPSPVAATYPADDVGVRGAAGCDATKITWKRGGSSSRFDRTVIVRSRTHIPTGPGDGARLPHGAGVLHDRGLSHFTAYQYRVFALYRSRTQPGTLNHSRGVVLRLRTGEICTPMDGGVITDTTPTVSWLRHSTLFGYSFLLFHGGDQVAQKRSVHARSYTFPQPPPPAPRLHLHALPLRVPAVPPRGHVDRADHVPRAVSGNLRRAVAERGRGEEDDLGRGRIDDVRPVDALAAKAEVGHRECERERDQAEAAR